MDMGLISGLCWDILLGDYRNDYKEIKSMNTDVYQSPLSERYASREMQYIFSQDMKFRTWRRLWIALAETEKELGLSQNGKPVITQEQIDELKAHAEDINYEVARAREKEVRAMYTLTGSSAPRRRGLSTWGPPPAMWGTIPTLLS